MRDGGRRKRIMSERHGRRETRQERDTAGERQVMRETVIEGKLHQ
jgi:hypothetical protein